MNEKKDLTPADKNASERLREIWMRESRRRGISQEQAAADLQWSATTVSNHLNGRMRISPKAVMKWASYLNCAVRDIRTDWDDFVGVEGGESAGMDLDEALFDDIFAAVERANEERSEPLSLKRRAKLVRDMYREALREERPSEATIRMLVRMLET